MGRKLSAAVILAATAASIVPVFAQNAGSSGLVYDSNLSTTQKNQIWSPGNLGPLSIDAGTGLLRMDCVTGCSGGGGGGGAVTQSTGNASTPWYFEGVSGGTPLPIVNNGNYYQLFGTYASTGQTSNATGTAVGPVVGGSYIFSVIGTFGSGTVSLQVLGPDGATWQTVSGASCTAACNIGVTIGSSLSSAPANVRAVLSGATSPSIWASLS